MALLKSDTDPIEAAAESERTDESTQPAEARGADIALIASAASVLLAWHQFYFKGNKTRGLFIGLWPPTILAFGSYLNQQAILDKLEQSLLSTPGSFESIKKLISE